MAKAVRGRFAPSPSGRMHLGNIYCALAAWLCANSAGGSMVLRIEDLDPARSRQAYTDQIMDDLYWLGLSWAEGPDVGGVYAPYTQSSRTGRYAEAFQTLSGQGLTYPCFCTRAERHAASAPHAEDGSILYSGRCAQLTAAQRIALEKVRTPAQRLRVQGAELCFTDGNFGVQRAQTQQIGDIIVRRSDGVYAYQLAVVADDGAMHITQVVRGRDLLPSTPVQIYLYRALGIDCPQFLHIPLLVAPDKRRLSKREQDLNMAYLRDKYEPQALLGKLAYLCGIVPKEGKYCAEELLEFVHPGMFGTQDIVVPSLYF